LIQINTRNPRTQSHIHPHEGLDFVAGAGAMDERNRMLRRAPADLFAVAYGLAGGRLVL